MIGENEFSDIPRSMFSIDERILPCTKKSQILHTIEKSVHEASMPKRNLIGNTDEKPLNAIIIDAMALLNKIQIAAQMKTCSEIKMAFKIASYKKPVNLMIYDLFLTGIQIVLLNSNVVKNALEVDKSDI